MIEFGERLRELRKERGITGYEMAAKLGNEEIENLMQ